jgi:cation:H+ antiporter
MKLWVFGLLTGRGPLLPLLAFVLAGGLIFLLGARLARAADTIAEETGLGRLWVGSLLLAASTSLPEVLTNVNAGLLGAPDIGLGDLLGASLANMLILAALDLIFARRRLLQAVALEHTVLALLSTVLAALVGLAVIVGGWGGVGHVGLDTITVGAVYVGGMRLLFRALGRTPAPDAGPPARRALATAALRFGATAAGLALTTPLLVVSAEAVSVEAAVSATLVGTLLVGLTTTLPETATTVSALRLGAPDLAVANVFGSVAFNLFAVLVLDLAYRPAPVLTAVSREHLLSILATMTCVTLGVIGIVTRVVRHPILVRVESALIVVTYLFTLWLLATPLRD